MRLTLFDIFPQLIEDYKAKLEQLGPPPKGYRYTLGEPQIKEVDGKHEIGFQIKLTKNES